MAGKTTFKNLLAYNILKALIVVCNSLSEKDNSIFIKGGLIFEKGSELPVTINPPSIVFTKFVNFSILDSSVNLAQKFTLSYAEFCENLNKDLYTQKAENRKKKFFVSEKVLDTRKLIQFCAVNDGHLPEIRNSDDLYDIIQIAKANNIERILAGIIVDTRLNQWVFISDKSNINTYDAVFQKAHYFREPQRSGNFEKDRSLTEEAERGVILYYLTNNTIKLSVYPSKDDWSSKGICQQSNAPKFESIEQTLLLKMTAHNCKRDLIKVQGTTRLVTNEADRFSKSNALTNDEFNAFSFQNEQAEIFKNGTENLNEYIKTLLNQTICRTKAVSSSCNEYLKFLLVLNDYSYSIANRSNLNTPLVILYSIHELMKQLKFLENKEPFEGCKNNTNLSNLPKHRYHENIERLLNYGDLMTRKCGNESSKEFVTLAIHKLESKFNIKDFVKIYYTFYDIAMNRIYNTTESRQIEAFADYFRYGRPAANNILETHNLSMILNLKRHKRFLSPILIAENKNKFTINEIFKNVLLERITFLWDSEQTNESKVDVNSNPPFYWLGESYLKTLELENDANKTWLIDFVKSLDNFEDEYQNFNRKIYLNFNDLMFEIFENNWPQFSQNKHIQKRFAAEIGMGIAAVSAGSSIAGLATGQSVFEWIGNTFGNTLGLATTKDLRQTWKAIELNSYFLGNISINQEELEKAYNNLGHEVTRLDSETKTLEYSTATLLTEMDTKLNLKHIQATVQLTVLKIANALSFAENHKASPYVFSRQELNQLATYFRNKKVQLSNNIADVYTTVYYDGQDALFTFKVPILEDKYYFTIYETKSFPIFSNNKVFNAKTDAKYFAYASSNNEYSLLTHDEYIDCKKNKYCTVEDVLRSVNKESHCTIKTLNTMSLDPICQYEEVDNQEPYFGLKDDTLLYSIKNETILTVICKNRETGLHERSVKTIKGVGMSKIPPDCQIDFGNGMRAFSNPKPQAENMGSVEFMDILNYLPRLDNFQPKIEKRNITWEFKNIELNKVNLTSYRSLMQEIINPQSALPEIFRILIALLVLAISFTCLCMLSKKVNLWFKTCILWKNPVTWYRAQGYEPGTFRKVPKEPVVKLKRNRSKTDRASKTTFEKTENNEQVNIHWQRPEPRKVVRFVHEERETGEHENLLRERERRQNMPPPDIKITPSKIEVEKEKEKEIDLNKIETEQERKGIIKTGYVKKTDREPDFDEEFHQKYKAGNLQIKPKQSTLQELMYPSISFRPINMMRTYDYPFPGNHYNKKPKLETPPPEEVQADSPIPLESSQEMDEVVIDQPYIYKKRFEEN